MGGAANLARYGDSFDSAVRPLLEALEEHVVLLKLLGEADRRRHRHGAHRPRGPLRASSPRPASSPRATGRATRRSPRWASSGPTRMDYPGTMAAVRAVARYVSRILDEG